MIGLYTNLIANITYLHLYLTFFNKAVTGIPPHPNEGEYKFYFDTIKNYQILGQIIILVYKSSFKNR